MTDVDNQMASKLHPQEENLGIAPADETENRRQNEKPKHITSRGSQPKPHSVSQRLCRHPTTCPSVSPPISLIPLNKPSPVDLRRCLRSINSLKKDKANKKKNEAVPDLHLDSSPSTTNQCIPENPARIEI